MSRDTPRDVPRLYGPPSVVDDFPVAVRLPLLPRAESAFAPPVFISDARLNFGRQVRWFEENLAGRNLTDEEREVIMVKFWRRLADALTTIVAGL